MLDQKDRISRLAPFQVRLGVIGAPPTWWDEEGEPVVFEPYVREMRVWAELFAHVEVCSSPGQGPACGNLMRYGSANIIWKPCAYAETFDGRKHQLKRLSQMPRVTFQIARTILSCDVILLRSPGHFALVGAALVRLLGRPSITKWAGYNGPFPGERFTSRLNRWLESLPIGRRAVLVYGPPKSHLQVSAIPALMSQAEISEARRLSNSRVWSAPWKILCVGRLAYDKNFELAIRALAQVKRLRPDLQWQFMLVGDGSMRSTLEQLAAQELNGEMTFTGSLPFDQVQRQYADSHIAIMPGVEEGWPKVIAEAWAHGTVPVAAAAGLVPSILEDPASGVSFQPTPEGLANSLIELMESPERMRTLSSGLHRFAEQLSLESFRDRLKDVLVTRLGLRPSGSQQRIVDAGELPEDCGRAIDRVHTLK